MAARYFSDVIDEETWGALHRRAQCRPLLHSVVVLTCYVTLAIVAGTVEAIWAKAGISLVLGVVFVGWFAAIHECVHGLFFSRKRLNRAAGVFWSCPTFLNFTLYRCYHLEHHRRTAVAGDPEPRGEYTSLLQYFRGLTTIWLPIQFLRMSVQAMYGRFPHYLRRPEHRRAVIADNLALVIWTLTAAIATVLAPQTMAWGYWLPLLIYFPMVTVTGLPEHYGCEETEDVIKNTRSTKSNFIFRYIYWNNNYHAEHHAFPQVPYSNLPRLNKLVGHRFKHQARSFIGFHAQVIAKLVRVHLRKPQS